MFGMVRTFLRSSDICFVRTRCLPLEIVVTWFGIQTLIRKALDRSVLELMKERCYGAN